MEIGKDGAVKIDFLGHAGFLINIGNKSSNNSNGSSKRIVIDPYNVSDDVAKESRADVILITHSHYDHCSIKDVEKLVDSEKGSVVICPADCQSKIMKIEGIQLEVVEVGDKIRKKGIKDYAWLTPKEMGNYDITEADLPFIKKLNKK